VLKSFTYAADDKLNVDRLDVNIMDVVSGLLKTATRVLSAIYNNQYYLYIENSGGNYIYRYYFELGVWVRDSTSLSFRTMDNDNNLLSTTMLNYDATQNTDAQKLKLMASGRFRYVKTDIQVFVNEAIQITGFTFVYKLNNPK